MSIRTITADSQPVVRAGLLSFFRNTDFQIIDEAGTGEQTSQKVLRYRPELLLLDANFEDESAFETVRRIRTGGYEGRVVFYSGEDRDTFLARALASGSDCYLSKKMTGAELVRLLYLAVEQKVPPYRGELERIYTSMNTGKAESPFSPLTTRESQVLRQIALGLSNKEIAATLGIGFDTAKEHVRNILRKLEVRDRTEAAVWAIKNKYIN